jgi:hypothetical protein
MNKNLWTLCINIHTIDISFFNQTTLNSLFYIIISIGLLLNASKNSILKIFILSFRNLQTILVWLIIILAHSQSLLQLIIFILEIFIIIRKRPFNKYITNIIINLNYFLYLEISFMQINLANNYYLILKFLVINHYYQ